MTAPDTGLMTEADRKASRLRMLLVWTPLWAAAAILLFTNLGVAGINGSEARWTIIVREMFNTGDFLHPTINQDPYNDKPLLSYWLIALVSLFNGREVSELAARIPSAVMALGALAMLVMLVKRVKNSEAALIAGWLFVSTYSFGFYGRLGEADMANLAFSLAAVLWFFIFRESTRFWPYLGFFAICAVGAHAKGMAAIAVPVMAVLADLIVNRRWKTHINWRLFAAAAAGCAVFSIPLVLAWAFKPAIDPGLQSVIDVDGTVKTSGLALIIRENVIRYFNPFDHNDESIFAYFVHVPRHLLPWTPFFVFALAWYFTAFRKMTKELHWLALTIGLIFVFFSLSGSRRHYYILPVIPFCVAFTAIYFSELESAMPPLLKKTNDFFLMLYKFCPPVMLALICVICVSILIFPAKILPPAYMFMAPMIKHAAIASGVFGVVICAALSASSYGWRETETKAEMRKRTLLPKTLFSVFLGILFVTVYAMPMTSRLRTGKSTKTAMGRFLKKNKVRQSSLVFYKRDFNDAVYYMDMPFKIRSEKEDSGLLALLQTVKNRMFIIARHGDFEALPDSVKEKLFTVVAEPAMPWEENRARRNKLDKKEELRAYYPDGVKIKKQTKKNSKKKKHKKTKRLSPSPAAGSPETTPASAAGKPG